MTTTANASASHLDYVQLLPENFFIDLTTELSFHGYFYKTNAKKRQNNKKIKSNGDKSMTMFTTRQSISAEIVLIHFIQFGGSLKNLNPISLSASKEDLSLLKSKTSNNLEMKRKIYLRSLKYLKFIINSLKSRIVNQDSLAILKLL